ncbi:MAG: hypothetical protein ACRDJP_14655 [Actinomycetota bacterium]
MHVLDALVAGAAAAPDGDGQAPPSAIELVWWGLDPEAAAQSGIERLHALLAWLDRVEFWPDLRAAFEELHEIDEAVGGDAAELLAAWTRSSFSCTPVPNELLPDGPASAIEQELAELIRAERTASVARSGRAADGYLCLFDALLIGLERLGVESGSVAVDDDEIVTTVTYLAAHPWVPATAPVPTEAIDAWRRSCSDDPELARALRLTGKLRRRCPDDHDWLMSVLGCGFAWLPLP